MIITRSSKHYIVDMNQGKHSSLDNMYHILKDATSIYIKSILSGSLLLKSKFSSKLLNKIQYWSYVQVLTKLESTSQTEGFRLVKVDPDYTSQTCSSCGTIDRSASKCELYECTACNLVIDSDTNGTINILQRGTYSSSTQNKQVNFTEIPMICNYL